MEHSASEITISKDGKSASAKSLLSLLGLELSHGSTFALQVEGGDEDACLSQLAEVLAQEKIIAR